MDSINISMGGGISMILNNYWNWRAYMNSHVCGNGGQSTYNSIYIGTKTLTGGNQVVAVSTYYTGAQENWSMSNLTSYVGSGTEAPVAENFKLGDDKTSSFANIQRNFNIASDGGGNVSIIHDFAGTNQTNTTITITELGIAKPLQVDPSGTTNTLIIRELLTQPVEVPPGRSLLLTFKWVEI